MTDSFPGRALSSGRIWDVICELGFEFAQVFGRKLLGVDQAEDELFGRAAEKPADEICEQLTGPLAA